MNARLRGFVNFRNPVIALPQGPEKFTIDGTFR